MSRTRGGEILVIDDDPDIREALGGVLELEGYSVQAFGDAREALAWLDAGHAPALVLLDLMMPGMNGWQFLAALEERPRLGKLPVVVLTGARESNGLHVSALLKKPVDLDVLLEAVRGLRDAPS